MSDLVEIARRAWQDLWDNLFLVVFCSVLWLVLVLCVIFGPPATLALFDTAERLRERERLVGFGDYLRAVWRNFGVGWRWGALNIVVGVIVGVDLRVVPRLLPAGLVLPVQIFFYLALALWIVVNFYALAFVYRQREASLRQAWKNGAILLLHNPIFALVVVAATTLVLWLSLLLVIVNVLLGPMFVALVSTHAVANRLDLARNTPEP